MFYDLFFFHPWPPQHIFYLRSPFARPFSIHPRAYTVPLCRPRLLLVEDSHGCISTRGFVQQIHPHSLSSVPPSSYPRLQSDRSVHLALYAAGHHHASLHFFLAGLIKRSSSIHVQLLSHHTCILHYRLHHLRFFLVTGANCF
jgi:hypothetical protein